MCDSSRTSSIVSQIHATILKLKKQLKRTVSTLGLLPLKNKYKYVIVVVQQKTNSCREPAFFRMYRAVTMVTKTIEKSLGNLLDKMNSFNDEELKEIKNIIESIIQQAIQKCALINREDLNWMKTKSLFKPALYEDDSETPNFNYYGVSNKRNSENKSDILRNDGNYLTQEIRNLSPTDGTDSELAKLKYYFTYNSLISGEDGVMLEKNSKTNVKHNFGESSAEDWGKNVLEYIIAEAMQEIEGEWVDESVKILLKAEENEKEQCISPFQVEWCFGLNLKVPIIYHSPGQIFFGASHMGVLYDAELHTMRFLSGLKNEVSCITSGGNYLALADKGSDTCGVLVWHSEQLTPQRCWLDALPGGAALLKMTLCGTYLTAVSASSEPLLVRWSISQPTVTATVLQSAAPQHLAYNSQDINQWAITFPKKIIIASSDNSSNKFTSKESRLVRCKRKSGLYRVSSFIDQNSQIVTGTSLGQAVVWDNDGCYVKTIQLNHTGVTWIEQVNELILMAFEDGKLWMYEQDLRTRGWLSLGTSAIVGFSHLPNFDEPIPDLAFTSKGGELGIVSNNCKRRLLYNSPVYILSLDCHPTNHTFAAGNTNGTISVFNIKTKTMELERVVVCCGISAIKFSSNGSVLGVGSEQGDLLILDPILLKICNVLPSARAAITTIIFTNNSNIMAYAHKDAGVEIFKMTVDWRSRGKYRAHCRPVTGMLFVGDHLITIAEDRMLAQYDVMHMLRLVKRFRIEDTALPTTCIWNEGLLLVTNSEQKLRFVDVERKEIVRTLRTPGSAPIHIMVEMEGQLIYAAGKNIGRCSLPWEGWGLNVAAHPRKISNLCSFGKGVLTSGPDDCSIIMWMINFPMSAPEPPNFSYFIDQQIISIFKKGPIKQSQLVNNLRFLGYFPSKLEIKNILKEFQTTTICENTFRLILWNHGPPPGIKVRDIRDALLSISEVVRMPTPMVQTERLLSVLTKRSKGTFDTESAESKDLYENMTREEALSCLKVLSAPGLMPPQIPLDQFAALIIGIDPQLMKE